MGEIDLKLLTLLQKSARMPMKTLSQAVKLPSPAVSARLSHMERGGMIRGYTAEFDIQKIGCHIPAYVWLDLPNERKTEFLELAPACPQMQMMKCSCVTGAYSILPKAGGASTQALDRLLGYMQAFGRAETQIVLSSPVPPRGIMPDAGEM